MKERVISGIIIAIIIIPVLYFGGILFDIAVAALSIIAFKELVDVKKDFKIPTIMKVIAIILMLILEFANIKGHSLIDGLNYKILALSFIILLIPALFYRNKGYGINNAFYLLSITIFMGVIFNFIALIYHSSVLKFIWLIIISCVTDTFALFGGKLIGQHKLTAISPKKTIEGTIVGTLVAIIIATCFYNIFFEISNIYIVIIIELILSIMGQIGDIFFSLIKRENNVKDFSNIIPGHGGILDRIDSIIFIIITYVFIMQFI